MIKLLLIEDEIPARNKLKRFIEELNTEITIVAEIDTVEKGIDFLSKNKVDLIFSDIELLDGNSFEIYSEVKLSCPIIFTTAYNQYWMEAFDTNGIAYLLKPFDKKRFTSAWDKFLLLRSSPNEDNTLLQTLTKIIVESKSKKVFKKRFTVHHQQSIFFVSIEQISYFEANEGVIFAHNHDSKKYLLNESTLKEIEDQLDPECFFRINRSEIVNKSYIEKIETNKKNTLAIKLKGSKIYLYTSQSNTSSFRSWVYQ
jgi:DNA-binding LytR/AlgR family response regulator